MSSGESAPMRSTTAMREALRFVVRPHWRALALMTTTAFIAGLAEALFLITTTRIAFAITGSHREVGVIAGWHLSLTRALLVCLGILMVRVALSVTTVWMQAKLATGVVFRIRQQLAAAFFDTSWPVQQEQQVGSLQALITGYCDSASALMGNASSLLSAGANLGALLGMAIGVEPLGAAVMVVSVVAVSALLRPLRAAVRRRALLVTEASMQLATTVNEVAELGLELHVFHVQHKARDRVGRVAEQSRRRNRSLAFTAGLSTPVYTSLAYFVLLGALAMVGEANTANLTSLGASLLVMLRSLSYGQAAQTSYMGISSNAPAIAEIQRRMHVFERGRRIDGGQPVGRVGAICVEHVSFAYVEGQGVLHDISFTIQPHEIVGIIGPSGGGKSTLVQLLLGLRDVDSGKILADGRDISLFDQAEWTRRVSFVPQSAHLVGGTIADNIRFFRDGVSQEQIESSARLAQLHAEIMRFPEGYERQVGERGGHLSGGQQQRLCIARALVDQPDVLILDEPTSSLDVKSEHLIRAALLELKEHMAVIVIAHRLSTLDMCDRIMVIQDGELKGFDTPVVLEQSNAFYREALVLSGMR